MSGKSHNLIDHLGLRGQEGVLLLAAVLIVVGGVWGFVALLGEVKEGDTQSFDNWAIQHFSNWQGPAWVEVVGRDITALGGVAVLTIFTLIVVGFLLMLGKYRAMWLVIIAVVGGLIISSLLKHAVNRPRPSTLHRVYVQSSSFPSGHSMMSAVVYLTLGSLLARVVHERRLKIYLICVAIMLTFLVGVSRVYMGVHYPTDVLAGWTAGLVWAILCWLVARQLQRRGAVETDGMGNENADKVTR